MFKQSQDPGLGEKYFKHTKRIIKKMFFLILREQAALYPLWMPFIIW